MGAFTLSDVIGKRAEVIGRLRVYHDREGILTSMRATIEKDHRFSFSFLRRIARVSLHS